MSLNSSGHLGAETEHRAAIFEWHCFEVRLSFEIFIFVGYIVKLLGLSHFLKDIDRVLPHPPLPLQIFPLKFIHLPHTFFIESQRCKSMEAFLNKTR